MAHALNNTARRQRRVRASIRRKSHGRPRLSVFRSGQNIYAQVIDDTKGVTLAAASSIEEGFKSAAKKGTDKAAAGIFAMPSS